MVQATAQWCRYRNRSPYATAVQQARRANRAAAACPRRRAMGASSVLADPGGPDRVNGSARALRLWMRWRGTRGMRGGATSPLGRVTVLLSLQIRATRRLPSANVNDKRRRSAKSGGEARRRLLLRYVLLNVASLFIADSVIFLTAR